ncbi:N-acetyl-gamma-glutamyl-phosphate reductase [Ferroacidibacillus organovorans]|nr:N-acetyl-gamma-glutamyl-phosphate reductase [Ferroacidibacillus organovorans]KYP80154.1 hypothetical protein AYJ22_02640 [Ferroacidibacillus organovorans]OAG95030.1 hypothetical protein AYW79_02100 [Ferroacidibacillus organovorans]
MRIAICGATGYSGIEAIRLLAPRTDVTIVGISSETQAGLMLEEAVPGFRGFAVGRLRLLPLRAAVTEAEIVILALPHGEAQHVAPELLAQGKSVIDLSGDHRLPRDAYESWYKAEVASDAHADAIYGLTEWNRAAIANASLVANPGCYATCAELALLPLLERDVAESSQILIDAKSGVSGAGKKPTAVTHYVEADENFFAYKLGRHQHTPEIEMTLREARRRQTGLDKPVNVLLATHLLPIKRGILCTAYIKLKEEMSGEALHEIVSARYEGEPFVDVLPYGVSPQLKWVSGTNRVSIGVYLDPRTQTAVVLSALDNLIKGAAGQAIQNLNVMTGANEQEGLWFVPAV